VSGSKPIGAAEANIAIDMNHEYRPGVVLGYPILRRLGAQFLGAIEFHDMTMLFSDHEEILYSDACCHLTEKGYVIFAEAIGNIILDAQISADAEDIGEQSPSPDADYRAGAAVSVW
jgi:hypothetical protein